MPQSLCFYYSFSQNKSNFLKEKKSTINNCNLQVFLLNGVKRDPTLKRMEVQNILHFGAATSMVPTTVATVLTSRYRQQVQISEAVSGHSTVEVEIDIFTGP